MAVDTTVVAAATYEALRDRVRRYAGDGRASTNYKFTDDDIYDALTGMLAEMNLTRQANDPASFTTFTTLSYPANTEFTDLSGAAAGEALIPAGIYRVEDITTANNPREIRYVAPFIAEKQRSGEQRMAPFETGSLQYTLINNQIGYRPLESSARNLRIWYLPAHVSASDGTPATDQHPFMPGHEELIVMGAVIRLQEIDDEIPLARTRRYPELWETFVMMTDKQRGPKHVQRVRRYF